MSSITNMLFGTPARRHTSNKKVTPSPITLPEKESLPEVATVTQTNYRDIYTPEELIAFIKAGLTAGLMAFDFETAPLAQYRESDGAALDPHRATIVGISLCYEAGNAVYIPIHHLYHRNYDAPEDLLPLLEVLIFNNKQLVKICHNMAFEASFLYKYGIILQPPVYDTIAAAQMSLNRFGQYLDLKQSGLKTLSKTLLGKDQLTFQEVTKGQHFYMLDPEDPATLRYACEDADFTLQLALHFSQWFKNNIPAHQGIVRALESPTAVYVGLMRYNGICVDKEYLEVKNNDAKEKIQRLKDTIFDKLQPWLERDIMGFIKFNLNSPQQLGNMLYQKMKLPIPKLTETGSPSTDDEALKKLRAWSKENRPELIGLFDNLLEYRKWDKIQSTYIQGLLNAINPFTGKIHTEFFPLGTETGRWSSRNPNLQNLPRASNDPIGIRKAFIPSPGHVLLDFDFSQIELRVAAYYSQDKNMLEVYNADKDIHSMTAGLIFGIEPGTETKEQRIVAKAVNFGYTYGLSPQGLQTNLEVDAGMHKSIDECKAIIAGFQKAYPGLQQYQRDIVLKARKQGYVETIYGRRRYIKNINAEDARRGFAERMAMNTPIQGSAADIMKRAIKAILEGLPGRPWLRPLLQVHDELLFETTPEHLESDAEFIKSCMEISPGDKFNVPIKASGSWGPNFAEAH